VNNANSFVLKHCFFVISGKQIHDFKCLPYCIVNSYDYKENLRSSVVTCVFIIIIIIIIIIIVIAYAEKIEITGFLI
jgi:hypothetical protein